MKCGIMTYHGIPNFGAVLQGYALCEAIRKLGHDCEIIQYKCENIVNRELVFHPRSNPIKNLLAKTLIWPHIKKKIKKCTEFESSVLSSRCYDRNTIAESNSEYDCFISGSDMIWNMDVNGNDTSFFLDFVEAGKRKIAYGSSIGASCDEKQAEAVKDYLLSYNSISVREADTQQQIQKMKLPCACVADPVLLLQADKWRSMASRVPEQNYVLVYFPYPDILSAARRYANQHHKKLIILRKEYFYKRENKTLYTPEEWISYIYNADAVFTDSYHGLLFSLLFHKQLWTANHGNRIESILNQLSLMNCYIDRDLGFNNRIDYDTCDKKIEEFRKNSLDYLRSALCVNQ